MDLRAILRARHRSPRSTLHLCWTSTLYLPLHLLPQNLLWWIEAQRRPLPLLLNPNRLSPLSHLLPNMLPPPHMIHNSLKINHSPLSMISMIHLGPALLLRTQRAPDPMKPLISLSLHPAGLQTQTNHVQTEPRNAWNCSSALADLQISQVQAIISTSLAPPQIDERPLKRQDSPSDPQIHQDRVLPLIFHCHRLIERSLRLLSSPLAHRIHRGQLLHHFLLTKALIDSKN